MGSAPLGSFCSPGTGFACVSIIPEGLPGCLAYAVSVRGRDVSVKEGESDPILRKIMTQK